MTLVERNEFLEEPGILMRIGVTRDDGSPLVTPIWFLYEVGSVYFTPRAQSDWFQSLRRDPRICLCIDEQALPYRKVVVEGSAELIHDLGADDEWRDLYRKIAGRYVPEDAAEAYVQNTIDQERALYRVVFDGSTVRTWRMPLDDEPETGIWHERYYAAGTHYADLSQ